METVWKILNYIGARLREPSSYPAVCFVLTAFGHVLAPEKREAITIIGMFAAGAIGACLPDRFGKNTRADDPEATLPPEKKEPK